MRTSTKNFANCRPDVEMEDIESLEGDGDDYGDDDDTTIQGGSGHSSVFSSGPRVLTRPITRRSSPATSVVQLPRLHKHSYRLR
jgi:hypothetical protein